MKFWLIIYIAMTLFVVTHCANANGRPYPTSWNKAATTASQINLTKFKQSPALDRLTLPPVKERLPKDPIVIEPLNTIGQYGGTARIENGDWWSFHNVEPPLTLAADLSTILPNLAKSYTVSEDGRTTTLYLREGIKWSDGEPLTADDFVFTFEDLWMNSEFSPMVNKLVEGGKAIQIDPLTIEYRFKEPNPLFVNLLAQYGDHFVDPKHYYKQFHPKYTNRQALDKKLAKLGYLNWMNFVAANRMDRLKESADSPTLRAYQLVSRSPTHIKYERNPYYFKVDPSGQQLPYIDAFESEIISDSTVTAAKAATGQFDFVGFSIGIEDFPILKMGESNGVISVYEWQRLHTTDVAFQPNFNHEDQQLSDLYWDIRFRKALSYAINREEINNIVYFGLAEPHQLTVHPVSTFYKESFAKAHTQFDPERSKALLDEIGLRDLDNDGLREHIDGSPLIITIEFFNFETPKEIIVELAVKYFKQIGLDFRTKLIDGHLQATRAPSGKMQMNVWHSEFVTDVLFPLVPDWWVPRNLSWARSMWGDWVRWYLSKGKMGLKPPAIMTELQTLSDKMRITMNKQERRELGKKILQINSEQLWTIGTVGLAPHPVVVSKRLKNVPEFGYWGWDNRWTLAYHPVTWFFNDESND